MKCQADLFELPEHVVYINCAYMSPLMKSVRLAGIKGIEVKSNPSSLTASEFFEPVDGLRKEFAKLIHADEYRRISVIPSASYGIANVANNIKWQPGDEVILAGDQFPSDYYIWTRESQKGNIRIRVVQDRDPKPFRTKRWNSRLLDAIGPSTKVVSIPIHHWADGTLFDIKEIRKKTREHQAYLVLDGTQSIGAYPFSVRELQPDALICAGYKYLLGPYSLGLAYYGPVFDGGTPIEESWMNREESHVFSRLVDYREVHRPYARKYDVGESSNFILVPMLKNSLERINEWSPDKIQEYCFKITREPLQILESRGIYLEEAQNRGSHLFGFRLPAGTDAELIKQKLSDAHIFISVRGDTIRVSPHVYNTAEQIQFFAEKLIEYI